MITKLKDSSTDSIVLVSTQQAQEEVAHFHVQMLCTSASPLLKASIIHEHTCMYAQTILLIIHKKKLKGKKD